MPGIESLIPLILQGGVAVVLALMWWFERQDKLYERSERAAERREYLAELNKRDARLNDMAERGINNAHATTTALTTIKDLIVQGTRQQ